MKYLKLFEQFLIEKKPEWQDLMEDFETENPELDRIRKFAGSIQDLHTWMRKAMQDQGRDGETNPYKDTIMVNGPQTGELDQSLPYQDFQNGKSDLVKNRHGRKDS